MEAQDAQQVKNIGKDIVALAKPLGVQQDIINRGKSGMEAVSGVSLSPEPASPGKEGGPRQLEGGVPSEARVST